MGAFPYSPGPHFPDETKTILRAKEYITKGLDLKRLTRLERC